MKLQAVPKLVGKYFLAVYTIAMVGALMLCYCPFWIQHEGYMWIAPPGQMGGHDDSWPRVWTKWSEIDTNSAWYKFGMWLLFTPGCLLVALPVTLLSSKEVLK